VAVVADGIESIGGLTEPKETNPEKMGARVPRVRTRGYDLPPLRG
jgi:hypothetical protein